MKILHTIILVAACLIVAAYATNASYSDNVTYTNDTPIDETPIVEEIGNTTEDIVDDVINENDTPIDDTPIVDDDVIDQDDDAIVNNTTEDNTTTPVPSYTGLEITELHPYGVDCKTEYLTITNNGKYDSNLKNWKIKTQCGHIIDLPDFDISQGNLVYIYTTKEGTTVNDEKIYLGLPHHQFQKTGTVTLYYENNITVNYK